MMVFLDGRSDTTYCTDTADGSRRSKLEEKGRRKGGARAWAATQLLMTIYNMN